MTPSLEPRRRLWVAAGALAVMVALAFVVTADNWVTRADADVVLAVAGDRTPALRVVAEAVTVLGGFLVLLGLTLGLWAGLARWVPSVRDPFLPLLTLLVAGAVDPLAKLVVGRPRPPADLAAVVEQATGYPSGHSAQSAATFLAIAFTLAPGTRHPGRWLAAACVIAGLVGVSRVVLGVHSPTDVLGGWCLGLACALLVQAAVRRWWPARSSPSAEHSGPARG